MRIISGTVKGRKLTPPPLHEKTIRPTSDRAREALFNILGPQVNRSKVLDLFAGTGALGLEAFSRGADLVIFVDNSPLSLKLLRRNIDHCAGSPEAIDTLRIVKHDLAKGLPIKRIQSALSSGFDLIFADPPYSKKLSETILNSLNNSSLLAQNGILIVEERFSIELPENLSSLALFDKRVYGETAFWFYQRS